MRKWLRFTGVLSKHINAKGFYKVDLVDQCLSHWRSLNLMVDLSSYMRILVGQEKWRSGSLPICERHRWSGLGFWGSQTSWIPWVSHWSPCTTWRSWSIVLLGRTWRVGFSWSCTGASYLKVTWQLGGVLVVSRSWCEVSLAFFLPVLAILTTWCLGLNLSFSLSINTGTIKFWSLRQGVQFWNFEEKTKTKQKNKNKTKKQKNLSAVFLTKWGVP